MTNDYPIIAYDNWLAAATFTFTAGTDNTAAPFEYVANDDLTSPALPTSAGALLTVEVGIPIISLVADPSIVDQILMQDGFALLQENGDNILTETNYAAGAQVFITGAARYDSVGYKTATGSFSIDYWNGAWTALKSSTALSDQDTSTIYKLAAHTLVTTNGVYKYRLKYTGLAIDSTVTIPELFLGPALEMPPVDFGYDEYNDVTVGEKFVSISGRKYKTAHYTHITAHPVWSVISRDTYDEAIMEFRDEVLERCESLWWAWQPDTSPNSCYLMANKTSSVSFPIKSPVHRSFSLDLEESL